MKHEASLGGLSLNIMQLELPVGLVVDSLKVTSGQASAGLEPLLIKLNTPANYLAVVTSSSVAQFLERKGLSGLKNFHVEIKEGRVMIEATARVIVEIRVEVTCELRIEDQTRLFVDLIDVSVPGSMAKNMVEKELAKANPVLDLSEVAPTVKMLTIDADNGQIVVTGTADWPQSS